MKYADRQGNITEQTTSQDKFLKALYTSTAGRAFLKVLIQPWFSKAGGKFLNTRFSKVMIRSFVKKNHIDMTEYETENLSEFASYNDFFMRKIKVQKRPVNRNPQTLISPCDSKLSVYEIREDQMFFIKNTLYSLTSLLRDRNLAKRYENGYAFVFRLAVNDYHRYCYADDGYKTANRYIQGVFHTVNPIANDCCRIYKENSREYSVLHSVHFGDVLMMEVGALLVGKIVNYQSAGIVHRGEEKGHFEFGGSTIILLCEQGKVLPDADLLANTAAGVETLVKYGEQIGIKA